MQGSLNHSTTAKLVALEGFLTDTFHFSSRRSYLIAQHVKRSILKAKPNGLRIMILQKISTGRELTK
jgi:hypothetical protein